MTPYPNKQQPNPNCFTLCVWEQREAEGQLEWRGTVHNLSSGHTYSFNDWPELVEIIAEALLKSRMKPQCQEALGWAADS